MVELASKCRDVAVFTDFENKVKPFVPFSGRKAYGKTRYIATFILHPALDGGEWSTVHPGSFKLMEGPLYPINKSKGGPGAGLDLWRR